MIGYIGERSRRRIRRNYILFFLILFFSVIIYFYFFNSFFYQPVSELNIEENKNLVVTVDNNENHINPLIQKTTTKLIIIIML